LSRVPELRLTTARVAPMVWWLGGRVRIYVPRELLDELPAEQLRWILAHELCHVRRGDHLVRWIEWLTCVAFWWNPVTWWARRNLRCNEEVCCDALVLRTLQGSRHSYANSLLTAVEFLATPGLRPPAMASQIDSGGFLERRFQMIVSKTPVKTLPRWLQGVIAASAALLMPLGVAYAQNPDVEKVAQRLERAVKAGELSTEEMNTMLGALKKSAAKQSQRRRDRAEARDAEVTDRNRQLQQLRRRVAAAIESGRLDEAEAEKIMAERAAQLQRASDAKDARTSRDRANARRAQDPRTRSAEEMVENVRRRVRAAVESGDMGAEEGRKIARERIEAIKEQFDRASAQRERAEQGKARAERSRADFERARDDAAELRKRTAELRSRTEGLRRKGADDRRGTDARKARLEALGKRLERAVKDGRMTQEQAKEMWEAHAKDAVRATEKRDRAGRSDRDRANRDRANRDRDRARARSRERSQRGRREREVDLTRAKRAEMEKKLAEHRKQLERMDKARSELVEADRVRQDFARARAQKDRANQAKQWLDKAVAEGRMSKAEAKKKWAAIKKEMAADKKAESKDRKAADKADKKADKKRRRTVIR
ncbi:MAG: hypothetical protein KAI24_03190, partial [Planctomycetes bacterium]|nr:hypothetical protein [Planctomycetota bacterium]